MKTKSSVNKVIANAIIWASIMIASSLLIGEHENSSMLMFLYIAGWFVTNTLVSKGHTDASSEERCCELNPNKKA